MHSAFKNLFLFFYFEGRERNIREKTIHLDGSLSTCLQHSGLAKGKPGPWSGLPCGWQGPKNGHYHLTFLRARSNRNLDLGAGLGGGHLKWHFTYCAKH